MQSLQRIENVALNLMNVHGLSDWSFKWDNAKGRNGCCKYKAKVIILSAPLTKLREFDWVKNTILHEIAHALSYINHKSTGHSWIWRKIFIQIGGNGETCSTDKVDLIDIAKYVGYCPNGHVHYRHRLSKATFSCTLCDKNFNKDYIIVYKLMK